MQVVKEASMRFKILRFYFLGCIGTVISSDQCQSLVNMLWLFPYDHKLPKQYLKHFGDPQSWKSFVGSTIIKKLTEIIIARAKLSLTVFLNNAGTWFWYGNQKS